MKSLLQPAREKHSRHDALAVLCLLLASAGLLLLAPWMMPEGYSWISHTTSESAAQGLENAWVARLGFLLFGLAVMRLAAGKQAIWVRGAVWMHSSFGVLMVATAVFSHKPWLSDLAFDPVEDHIHSFTATTMGFAFAFGVVFRLVQRLQHGNKRVLLDFTALLAATFIPLLMVFQPDMAGVVQRLMFLVAYVWYGSEAWTIYRKTGPSNGKL